MTEWLLIFLTSTGHVNGHVDQFLAERYKSQAACEARAAYLHKTNSWDSPRHVCIPVAAVGSGS